ncbi:MAG TPA: YkvA family protein [bacterium]|jgi:uncharacterized membrane protein YkvA (DUF1232 family)
MDQSPELKPVDPREKEFPKKSLWEKLGKYAKLIGRPVVEMVLRLYYAYQEKTTPLWAKSIINGALLYFIFPLDVIVDFIPGVGYTDDLGVLAMALGAIAVHITPEIKKKAKATADKWFGEEAADSTPIETSD